jgi:hypothetical protein
MLFEEIIAVYSENHKNVINILCVQNAELMIVDQVVHIVPTRLSRVILWKTNMKKAKKTERENK